MLSIKYSAILKVAIPLMAGTFIQSLVMITDASILSRYSTLSFDASGNAGLLYVTLFMGLAGFGDAAQIIMARRAGANEKEQINGLMQSSLFINILLSCIFFVIITFVVPQALLSYSLNKDLAQEQLDFLTIRSIGFFMAAIMLTLNAFFMAIGKTWVILLSTLIFALTNIVLDFILVFGTDTIPAMGIKGAAWASVLAELCAVLFLLFLLLRSPQRKEYKLFSNFNIAIYQLKQLIKVGSPLMIQGFFALATWTMFFTWIEQIGTYELTVSQNIRSIYMLAFVPIFGFGATTKTYVSQYMNQNDPVIIKKIIRRIQLLTVLFVAVFFHGALLYPETLITLINPEQAYVSDSIHILQLVIGSIFIFALITPLFQTINGSGNTMITLIIEIASIITYLFTAYTFIKVWQLPISQVWLVEYVYFGTIGLFSILYLRFFNWSKKTI
jgi:putative MATE family efflux protein